jgi:hypothetical protein
MISLQALAPGLCDALNDYFQGSKGTIISVRLISLQMEGSLIMSASMKLRETHSLCTNHERACTM